MPDGKIGSKTGNAQVVKQGHTHDGQHGSDPFKQVKGRGGVVDLKAGSKR